MQHDHDDNEADFKLMEGCADMTRWLAGLALLAAVVIALATCASLRP